MKRRAFFLRPMRLGAVGAWLVVWISFSTARLPAEDLPRYKLEPGQQLTYRLVTPQLEWDDGSGGKIVDYSATLRWDIYVVRKNDDGTWKLVFTNRWSSKSPRASDVYSDGHFDLAPDGRLSNVETLQPGIMDVTVLFPPLPADEKSISGTWQATSPVDGANGKLRVLDNADASSATQCRIEEEIDSLINSIYEITERREYVFDCRQGVVRTGTIARKQPFHPRRFDAETPIELVGVRRLERDELAQLDDEVDRYLAADRKYRALINRATHRDFENAEGLLDEAEGAFEQLVPRLKLPLVKTMLEARLKTHDRTRSYYVSQAASCVRMANQPAPEWQTTDLDGNSHKLADYRGKVVVLDFWYRGCGWCTRCIPQIKQLVEDFRGQDVVILGMNCDEDESDARFVIEKARLNYPTLKDQNQRIRMAFRGAAAYPSMIIIDGGGVVRYVHVGYSPTLREEVGDVIRELLTQSDP